MIFDSTSANGVLAGLRPYGYRPCSKKADENVTKSTRERRKVSDEAEVVIEREREREGFVSITVCV